MKTALVTGSSSGIGKRIAIDLLMHGYFVFFCGRNAEKLKQLKKELNNLKITSYKIIKSDLSNIKNISSFIKNTNSFTFDVVVLNAGVSDRSSFKDISYKNWMYVMNTNLTIPFFLIQKLFNKINNDGKIIFISSILGIYPDSKSISYGVSKAGINMLVPHLARVFAEKNINVNAIAPGFVNTAWHDKKAKDDISNINKKILLKRFAEPCEISHLVLEIINNKYINGSVFKIDGGYGLNV
jgi:NAD(P)-dependent dehydrogenase (short-subunit alcohol dehydrogenase family)